MGGFSEPQPAAGVAPSRYYSAGRGANFGGYCANAACPVQREADKKVAACLGFVRGNPYYMDQPITCPGCAQAFEPQWMWFAQCRVVIRKVAPAPDTVLDLRGVELRQVVLDRSGMPQCVEFETTAN